MENNADLNAKDDSGETPLHKCAEYGKRTFLTLLETNTVLQMDKYNFS